MREASAPIGKAQMRVKTHMRELLAREKHRVLPLALFTNSQKHMKNLGGFFISICATARNHCWPSNVFSRQYIYIYIV